MFFRSEQPQQTASLPAKRDDAVYIAVVDNVGTGAFNKVAPPDDDLGRALGSMAKGLEQRFRETLSGLVGVSMSCAKAMINIAEMLRDVREVGSRSQAIAAASEEMVASVQDIARNSEAAAADARDANQSVSRGLSAAARAATTMENIAKAVEDAGAKVDGLSEASTKIGEIVLQIEAIAQQTNLLALNATIEAARAGEAGKGFAVVAGEVKSLANQTAKATVDIRNRIEQLRTEMAAIVASMKQGADVVVEGREVVAAMGDEMRAIGTQVEGVTAKMQEIASILGQQSEASHEISEGVAMIAEMSDRNVHGIEKVVGAMDEADAAVRHQLESMAKLGIDDVVVQLAKADHVSFKKRILETLVGKEHLRSSDLPTCRDCRLGKWYYAQTDEKVTGQPAFRELEHPHDLVHSHGKQALAHFENGNLDAALDEVAKVDEASVEVVRLLDKLAAGLVR